MKHAKAHPKLLYGYSLLIIFVSVILIEFIPNGILAAYRLHWLVLVAVLALCVSPFGHNKMITQANKKPPPPFWLQLIRLFALQIALFFVFVGMTLVFTHWIPAETAPDTFVIQDTFNTLLKQDGLLPWGIYALYAGGFAYISYLKKQDAYVGSLITPLLNKKSFSLLHTALNLQGRSCVFMTLATSFAFITLLIASMFTPKNVPLLYGFHGKTMIIIFALVLLGFTPPFKKIIHKLLNPKMPLAFTVTTTLVLFALLIWSLNAFFGTIGQSPLPIPALIQWIERKNPITLWIIFSAAWWIGWTPLIAGHIVNLSHGYRIRSMMLATLILPTAFTLLFIQFPSVVRILHIAPFTTSLLAIIAFFYLLSVLTQKINLPMMIRAYLPKYDNYKRRDHYFYFRKLFQVMLIVIYLYLPSGISITVYTTFMFTLFFTLQIPFAMIEIFRKIKYSG